MNIELIQFILLYASIISLIIINFILYREINIIYKWATKILEYDNEKRVKETQFKTDISIDIEKLKQSIAELKELRTQNKAKS